MLLFLFIDRYQEDELAAPAHRAPDPPDATWSRSIAPPPPQPTSAAVWSRPRDPHSKLKVTGVVDKDLEAMLQQIEPQLYQTRKNAIYKEREEEYAIDKIKQALSNCHKTTLTHRYTLSSSVLTRNLQ